MDGKSTFRERFGRAVGRPPDTEVPLRELSSFKIGGSADLFFESRTKQDLVRAVAFSVSESYPYYVIGGGFNILFDDAGFRGLLIKNRAEGISTDAEKGTIRALSGTSLTTLLQATLEQGLGGLEFLAGIPGTVGGGVYGNAGAFGRSMGDVLLEAVLLGEKGEEKKIPKADFGFGYRRSSLQQDPGIVLEVAVAVSPADRRSVRAEVSELLEKRKAKQPPWGTACAGSYFKNPCAASGERTAAGFLLEKAGARGMRIGDAAVYEGHCNFIVNLGNATSADVLGLARELKKRVFEDFGILLEEEVIHLPADASML